jgi:NAD(P)-dependent dehydrogenase (short-subunit alcohol dehydrogenase family)
LSVGLTLYLYSKEELIMNMCDLSQKVAVVTGGNRGIGFAIAKGLASAGAAVVIANRRAEEGEKAAKSLRKEGLKAVAIPADITSMSSVRALVARVISDFGKIDILVNNAGLMVRKPVEDITEEDWNSVINTNLKGMFFCCQIVGREMIRNKKGRIINISSLRSQKMAPNRSVYAISKGGVSNLTRAFAYEWGKHNITVNAIAPGTIITDFNRKHFEDHPEELAEIVKSIPKGRAGNPSDCVSAAIFLASDESDFVTGQTVFADGGTSIC